MSKFRDKGTSVLEKLNNIASENSSTLNAIFKILAGILAVCIILLALFLFQKEIIEWADKPADNASVVLIVVIVCYVFSLPVTSKLNKIIDLLEDNSEMHQIDEHEYYEE